MCIIYVCIIDVYTSICTSEFTFPDSHCLWRIHVTHETPEGHPCTQHQWVATAGGRARYTYTCPFCDGTINSSIETGCVNHRTICGNQFRVRNGSIVAGSHKHTCPKCGTEAWSTQATGRIRASHLTPEGHPCKQHEWVAK